MKMQIKSFFYKIVIVLSIVLTLTNFFMSPIVQASSVKTEMQQGEFYYSGTTTGSYKASESILKWLLNAMGDIVDFLLGLFTMGGRMVFVGWAALFEELITWALEATVGIPMDVGNDVNSALIDGTIKSSNNVTIEAIVYNKVPILDINLFKDEEPKCVTGTGNYIVECETCYLAQLAEEGRSVPTNGREKKYCRMEECTCHDCYNFLAEKGYYQADAAGNAILDEEGKPIRVSSAITVIKENVSKWYYVIRLVAIIAMLLILVVAGIKMAISSAASEKALYKRILVDWVVGMIIVFSIHYFMLVIINLNEVLVNFIRDTDTGISEILKKELYYGTNETEQELEISLYQAVRTRAYDPKLINGTTGTVLYVTLVFYTVRFVFTYLKRYLTIIILTLMAPGIAFGYALQKILTSKSKSFSEWLSDYFINVFIQTVHALIYTIFVSEALIVSLNSIPGMIVAFIFINFMLKADDIFRKLFRLSNASTEEAMKAADSVKNLRQSASKAMNFMVASNLMKNSPVTKAVTAPLKGAFLGAVVLNSNIRNRNTHNQVTSNNNGQSTSNQNNNANSTNTTNSTNAQQAELLSMSQQMQQLRSQIDPSGQPVKEFKSMVDNYDPKQGIGYDGQDAMEKELHDLEKLAFAKNVPDSVQQQVKELRAKFDKATNISTMDVVKEKIDNLLDESHYFEYDARTGKRKLKYGLIPKYKYDASKNEWVKHSLDELLKEQFKAKNLLGFTEEDEKMWKEVTGFAKGTLLGMGSLFVGLGTVVSNPAVGMGLLANGTISMLEFGDKTGWGRVDRTYRPPIVDEKNKKYSFSRFGKGAKQRIAQSIKTQVKKEQDRAVVENVRKNHKTLYRTLKIGGAGLVVAGAVGLGGVAATPFVLATGAVSHVVGKSVQRYSGYSQHSLLGKISRHHFKQLKKQREELIKDEIKEAARDEAYEMEKTYNELIAVLFNEIDEDSKTVRTAENVEQEQKARLAEDAIVLKSGETVQVSEMPQDIGPGIIKQTIAREMIEEAVSKVLINEIMKESTELTLDSKNINTETRKVLEKRLKAYGILGEEKIETRIQNLDKEIEDSAIIIMQKELGIDPTQVGFERHTYKEVEVTELPNTEAGSVTDIQDTESMPNGQYRKTESQTETRREQRLDNRTKSRKSSKDEMSAFEKVLVSEVIKEKAQSEEIKEVSDIAVETILDAVKDKKKKLATRRATSDVIKRIKEGRNEETPMFGDANPETQPMFSEISEIKLERVDVIEKGIGDIKREGRRKKLSTPEMRREEKRRAVMELSEVLMDAAIESSTTVQSSETQLDNSSQNKTEKSTAKTRDQIIQELFDRKEDRQKAYSLLENIDSMKKLNRRGETAKIKTSNIHYHHAKSLESLKQEASIKQDGSKDIRVTGDQDIKVTGDREVKRMRERSVRPKESHGPVTDIVESIRKMAAQNI